MRNASISWAVILLLAAGCTTLPDSYKLVNQPTVEEATASAQPVTMDCIDCPVSEVVQALSLQSKVPIYVSGALATATVSVYGIASYREHLDAMAISLGAEVLTQGDALIFRQLEGNGVTLLKDYGAMKQGEVLPGGLRIVDADPGRAEILRGVDFRPKYHYVDIMLVTGLAEAEISLGAVLSASAGVEAGSLVVSVGVEEDKQTLIDVGEARYVRKSALQEGVLIETEVEELRIPRELKITLNSTGWLEVMAKADTVRGEAAGLPEIARTEYSTVSYVDTQWRIIGTLTDRQSGMFASFSDSAASVRGRHRGRTSVLIARVQEQREVPKWK